ncbi:MAG: hypothetical protein RBS88_08455 [Spongiibacteraceae bacterium]|jgi:hypothetical protein|nr:hypothetical protein [Spongiibacteraceae bacterium]
MNEVAPEHKLSTSAVAKALHLPLQQLFTTLRDYGWIRKADDGWLLTGKGEFEGGEYVHSRRYGRYIVWPAEILEHPLLRGLEDNRHWNALQLGRRYGISAREVQRLLGELGLLRRDFNGWHLTRAGEALGGVLVDQDSPFPVLWPESALQEQAVQQQLEYGRAFYQTPAAAQDDLLTGAGLIGLDGHVHRSHGRRLICDWLYLAGVLHACDRALPHLAPHHADFWLPEAELCIDYSGDEGNATQLSATLARLEHYRRSQLDHIEVQAAHLPRLDEFLTGELRQRGVPLR